MSTHAATMLLIMTGRIFGPHMPEEGAMVVLTQTVEADKCEALATVPVITNGGYTFVRADAICGHALDWANIVNARECLNIVSTGLVRIERCER